MILVSIAVSLCNRDHHIAAFVPGFDVAMRVNNLLQRIDAVNHRFEMAGLDQFFKPHERVRSQWGRAIIYRDQLPVRRECLVTSNFFAIAFAHRVENQIVTFRALGEILADVINHRICAQRFHKFDICSAAHPGYLRAEILCHLDGECAGCAGSAKNQHPLPGLHLSLPQEVPGQPAARRQSGGLGVAQVGWFMHNQSVLGAFYTIDGLPGMTIVGLPDAAVQESRERVQAAIKNAGLSYPRKRIVVNLAPTTVRKEGPAYDLPIALSVMIMMGLRGSSLSPHHSSRPILQRLRQVARPNPFTPRQICNRPRQLENAVIRPRAEL